MKVPILLLVVFVLAPVVFTAASSPEGCKECHDTGLVPCSKHKSLSQAKSIDPNRRAVYCNAAVECDDCRGIEWHDCEDCTHAEAEQWLAKRTEELVEGGKRAAKFDKFMERRLVMAESEHFVLVCEMKPRKAGKTKSNTHQLLHIYLDRLELMFDDYCASLQAERSDFTDKVTVFLWEEVEDHEKASAEYCKWESEWSQPFKHRRGSKPKVSIHVGDKRLKKDEELHRMVMHQVMHCLMNLQKPSKYTGDCPGGWADVGVPHWFCNKHFGMSDTTCFPPVKDTAQFVPKRWRTGVRKMLEGDRNMPLEDFAGLMSEQLTGEQHALAFGLVDYLMARDPALLNKLLKRVRSRTPFRDSIKELYGEKVKEFEKAWKEWVSENYRK